MLDAFAKLGFEVTEIVGYSAERQRSMAAARSAIRRGERYEFCYVETTTMPMALGDPGHLPVRPKLDLRFLSLLKERGIPIFVFYRDAHWRFPTYGGRIHPLKRKAALVFYEREFFELSRIADRLYLPSLKMDPYLPAGERRSSELPPGCEYDPLAHEPRSSGLDLLYVGGVTPPIYDLTEMLAAVDGLPGVRLTIVCREREATSLKERCKDAGNIVIEHKNAADVRDEYQRCDIASLYLMPGEYFSFAMPVKLFEAVGYGMPVLARAGTAAADFVAREKVGWVASGAEEARALLARLAANPAEVDAMRGTVREAALRHTWAERAKNVAAEAAALKKGIR